MLCRLGRFTRRRSFENHSLSSKILVFCDGSDVRNERRGISSEIVKTKPVEETATTFWDIVYKPVEITQDGLHQLHDVTGLPWWSTVIVGAVTLRVSMIPLLYYSANASKNMATARADIERLSKPYAEAVKRASSSSERWQKAMIYYRGLRAAWRIHDANPLKLFVPALVQIPFFITFVLAWRGLIRTDESLQTGGALWFQDLTIPDETFALPIAGIGITYLSLQLAGQKDSESPGQFVPWLLDSVSLMLIGAAPFVVILPSGVFMYWITSSTWGLAQGAALRNPAFRRAIRMPTVEKKAMAP